MHALPCHEDVGPSMTTEMPPSDSLNSHHELQPALVQVHSAQRSLLEAVDKVLISE